MQQYLWCSIDLVDVGLDRSSRCGECLGDLQQPFGWWLFYQQLSKRKLLFLAVELRVCTSLTVTPIMMFLIVSVKPATIAHFLPQSYQ